MSHERTQPHDLRRRYHVGSVNHITALRPGITGIRADWKDVAMITQAGTERIYSDEYTGPRWTYALRYRPMQIGAQPAGYIIGSDGPAVGRARYGTIQYPRQLSPDEVYSFELEEVTP